MLETAIDHEVLGAEKQRKERLARFTFLWLVSLIPRKSANLVMMSLKQAISDSADLELCIAGNGSEDARLKNIVCELDLESRVRFLGWIEKAEVNSLMEQVNAFLFTSVRDTSGNVVLEALSRGLPVLALNNQGVLEMCDDEGVCLIQPEGIDDTIQAMAEGMKRLQKYSEYSKRIGEVGQKESSRSIDLGKLRSKDGFMVS
jgi:glycosyltransferase involved in cell wall biosynthesis